MSIVSATSSECDILLQGMYLFSLISKISLHGVRASCGPVLLLCVFSKALKRLRGCAYLFFVLAYKHHLSVCTRCHRVGFSTPHGTSEPMASFRYLDMVACGVRIFRRMPVYTAGQEYHCDTHCVSECADTRVASLCCTTVGPKGNPFNLQKN